jgi:hypothetical protein
MVRAPVSTRDELPDVINEARQGLARVHFGAHEVSFGDQPLERNGVPCYVHAFHSFKVSRRRHLVVVAVFIEIPAAGEYDERLSKPLGRENRPDAGVSHEDSSFSYMVIEFAWGEVCGRLKVLARAGRVGSLSEA